jgi:CheY-like chemotaxis protein
MTAKKPENTSNILIVDDNKFIREVLTKILQRTGYYVTSIETGEEMLEKLKSHAYNVAIIDVRLKDTNGIDILGKIQKNTTNMKKIILTGYPSDEDKKRALEQGADCYISKPIKSEKLIEIVKKLATSRETKKYYLNTSAQSPHQSLNLKSVN